MVDARLQLDDVPAVDDPPLVGCGPDFESYVRGSSARLCRSAFLLTGDRQLAEDLVQTALAKVALRWDQVVAGGDPTPYVRTVMVRTVIAWRRRRWRGEVPTAPVPDRAHFDPSPVPEHRERLRAALLALGPRQRAAVVLRFYEDLSEAETAEILGCAVGTVKSQTARGLAHVKGIGVIAGTPTADSVTVAVHDGVAAGATLSLTLSPATEYLADDRPCTPEALTTGQEVGFAATYGPDGSLAVDVVVIT